jgi:hypothetical protein
MINPPLQPGQVWKNALGSIVKIEAIYDRDTDHPYPFQSQTINGVKNQHYIYDVYGRNYGGDNCLVEWLGSPVCKDVAIDFEKPIRHKITHTIYNFVTQTTNGTVVVEDPNENNYVSLFAETQLENFTPVRSATNEIVLVVDSRSGEVFNCINGYANMMGYEVIGRNTITLSEGDGMEGNSNADTLV